MVPLSIDRQNVNVINTVCVPIFLVNILQTDFQITKLIATTSLITAWNSTVLVWSDLFKQVLIKWFPIFSCLKLWPCSMSSFDFYLDTNSYKWNFWVKVFACYKVYICTCIQVVP